MQNREEGIRSGREQGKNQSETGSILRKEEKGAAEKVQDADGSRTKKKELDPRTRKREV